MFVKIKAAVIYSLIVTGSIKKSVILLSAYDKSITDSFYFLQSFSLVCINHRKQIGSKREFSEALSVRY